MGFLQQRDSNKEQPEPPVSSDKKPASKAGVQWWREKVGWERCGGGRTAQRTTRLRRLAKDHLSKTFATITTSFDLSSVVPVCLDFVEVLMGCLGCLLEQYIRRCKKKCKRNPRHQRGLWEKPEKERHLCDFASVLARSHTFCQICAHMLD